MHKRVLAMAAVLSFAIAAGGCNNKNDHAQPKLDNLPTISAVTMKVDTGNFDGELISQALDEYVAPLVGAHVSLEYIETEQFMQEFSKYMATNNLPDTFLIWFYSLERQLIDNGQLLPLDALLEEYGGGIISVVDKELLDVNAYNGETYAVANQVNRATSLCFEYRKNIADANGLDMASVNTLEDLTAVLTQLKQNNSDIVPMSAYNFRTWDPLSNSLGVLMDYGQSTRVVNLYDTEEYRDICHFISLWRKSGLLLNEDFGLTSVNSFVRSPEFFGKLCGYSPGLPYLDSADAGEPIECVILGKPYSHSDSTKGVCWGISADTEYPVESMKFINLMYSDPYVVNLLSYGIEGLHYEISDIDKGIIDFPEGITAKSSGYAQFRSYYYGNQFIGYVWNGWPTDLWKQIQTFNKEALYSKAYGFSYDPLPVANQVNVCQNVVSEYTSLLEKGVEDVDTLLAEFRAALKDAEVDWVVADKQRQLDFWLAKGREK